VLGSVDGIHGTVILDGTVGTNGVGTNEGGTLVLGRY
jgi:hypothetical protein